MDFKKFLAILKRNRIPWEILNLILKFNLSFISLHPLFGPPFALVLKNLRKKTKKEAFIWVQFLAIRLNSENKASKIAFKWSKVNHGHHYLHFFQNLHVLIQIKKAGFFKIHPKRFQKLISLLTLNISHLVYFHMKNKLNWMLLLSLKKIW